MTKKQAVRELSRGVDRDKEQYEAKHQRGAYTIWLRDVGGNRRMLLASTTTSWNGAMTQAWQTMAEAR